MKTVMYTASTLSNATPPSNQQPMHIFKSPPYVVATNNGFTLWNKATLILQSNKSVALLPVFINIGQWYSKPEIGERTQEMRAEGALWCVWVCVGFLSPWSRVMSNVPVCHCWLPITDSKGHVSSGFNMLKCWGRIDIVPKPTVWEGRKNKQKKLTIPHRSKS